MYRGRILVVDDDETSRSLLRDCLMSFGYEVVTAGDGKEALDKFVPGVFDGVISDLFMPNIDGVELLRNLKIQDKSICFLMITGCPSIEGAVNAMREGAYDYVTKPFHMEDIRIKLERMLKEKKMAGSLKTMTGLSWALIISIPIWLILGVILSILWK